MTAFLLVLAAAFFWAGFRAAPHPLQHQSKAGFVVVLDLAAFAGYFAWRESRAVAELAELIDPVPQITGVSYVPTATEVAVLSEALATMPGDGRLGTTRDERRRLARDAAQRRTQYWLLTTALSPDSVLAFYRERAPRRGWAIGTDAPPWLILSGAPGRLTVFVRDDHPRPGSTVLYGLSPAMADR